MPTYTDNKIGTIDLMRYDPEKAPAGSMDYLFLHLFEYMKEEQIEFFNWGCWTTPNVVNLKKSFN